MISLEKIWSELQNLVPREYFKLPRTPVPSEGDDYNVEDVNCVCGKVLGRIESLSGYRFKIINITRIVHKNPGYWYFSMFITDQNHPSLTLEIAFETDDQGYVRWIDIPALMKYSDLPDALEGYKPGSEYGRLEGNYTSSLERLQTAYQNGESLARTLSKGDGLLYR